MSTVPNLTAPADEDMPPCPPLMIELDQRQNEVLAKLDELDGQIVEMIKELADKREAA